MNMIRQIIATVITLFCFSARADALDRIRIAVSNPNMPNLTVAVAQQKSFFRDENIEAEIIRMNPNVAITALATADVDYCQLFAAVVSAGIAGLPVRIVAGFLDNWPMTLIAQPEYKSLKELKGKTLGISSFGATPDVGARMMLKRVGLDPEKDIKVLALGSDAARLTALKQRVVDVVVISPPADAQMEKEGYKILARAYELFSFPYLGLGTHTKKMKEKPEEIRRTIKATIRANVLSARIAKKLYEYWLIGEKSSGTMPTLPMTRSEICSTPTAMFRRTVSSSSSTRLDATPR